MRFLPTAISGAYIVEQEPREDRRGTFSRVTCVNEFEAAGLEGTFAQINVNTNELAGTLRGLHVQLEPYAEAKLIRFLHGSIFDVGVDVREDSPSQGSIVTVTLAAAGRRMLFLPPGCAHGFQTLADDTEVMTFHSALYAPAAETCFMWDEPKFAIPWPLPNPTLSDKDQRHSYL